MTSKELPVVLKLGEIRCPYCNTRLGEVEEGRAVDLKYWGTPLLVHLPLAEGECIFRLLPGYALTEGIWRMDPYVRQRLVDGRRPPRFRRGGKGMAPVPPARVECWRCGDGEPCALLTSRSSG